MNHNVWSKFEGLGTLYEAPNVSWCVGTELRAIECRGIMKVSSDVLPVRNKERREDRSAAAIGALMQVEGGAVGLRCVVRFV